MSHTSLNVKASAALILTYLASNPASAAGLNLDHLPQNESVKALSLLDKLPPAGSPGTEIFNPIRGGFDPTRADWANGVWGNCPLVLDLDQDPFLKLLSAEEAEVKAISFDLNADGEKETTGWINRTSGFLARDVNGDGLITSGAELFGEATGNRGFTSGFAALSSLDDNNDGRIDVQDTEFAKLSVWRDANLDGTSQASELKSLRALGITEINLETIDLTEKDLRIKGNQVTAAGYYIKKGQAGLLYDVTFTSTQAQ